MITIKTEKEIELMREPCAIVRDTLAYVGSKIRPGVTTKELDEYAEDYIRSRGAIPSELGYCGYPASICASVNEVVVHKKKLVRVTEECFYKGIENLRAGTPLYDIGARIQRHAESNGFSVVRALVGHGIGREMHEDPSVPNFGKFGTGIRLKAGMTICIEPMINMGRYEVETLGDGWTVRTRDGKPAAHYENTVLIREDGVEILTI